MMWRSHSSRSVILWTRLTPPSGTQNRPAFLDYCVSKDQKFKSCVSRGTAITDGAVDYTVKVTTAYRPAKHCAPAHRLAGRMPYAS
jgi:phosphodiesterase/alkaline phosphatase D-like protein